MNHEANHTPETPAQGTRTPRPVYAITEREGTREGSKSFWTRVGSAWTNRDGSITVRLDALPVSGVLQVRDADEHREQGAAR